MSAMPARQPQTTARPQARPSTASARLAVVAPPRPAPARMPFLLLVGGILTVGLVSLLLLNTALTQGSFTATDLQRQANLLADRQQVLEQALDQAQAPQELAARARGLGMVPGGSPLFLRTPDGAILGDRRAAKDTQHKDTGPKDIGPKPTATTNGTAPGSPTTARGGAKRGSGAGPTPKRSSAPAGGEVPVNLQAAR